MRDTDYYSRRNGKHREKKIDLEQVRMLFLNTYNNFDRKCFFQEAFGYFCVDEGYVPGESFYSDEHINCFLQVEMGTNKNLWPITVNYREYSENELFDMIEFLYDYISEPTGGGRYHSFSNCGWHDYTTFDAISAKKEYQEEINKFLNKYSDGYELNKDGHIYLLLEPAYEGLINAPLVSDDADVKEKISLAVKNYRLSRNLGDMRNAIRELADILERLRPELKKYFKGDESDLFNIMNNFTIRHYNEGQKEDYDKKIFYSWMFYVFLATVHVAQRLIEREKNNIFIGPG